jgi:glycosyltransferase involved in cell wall biosynthesis
VPLRIAIAKPDYGIRGGFEGVVDRIAEHLTSMGHEVSWLGVDATVHARAIHHLDIPDEVRENAAEYFRYLSLLERFTQLDGRHADVVLCTQPSSWGVRHHRKVALFYHHLRVFYDLADHYVAAGFVDPTFHELCVREIRSVDRPHLDSVAHFLVPSTEVSDRLARFNGIGPERGSPFLAAPPVPSGSTGAGRRRGDGIVLCVSRHEWPKRTELVVAAAHHLAAGERPPPVALVGDGGRLEHVRSLDRRLRADGLVEDGDATWLSATVRTSPEEGPGAPNLRVLGRVSDAELDALYRDALCVVAPALLEDYGLTAIEAMGRGVPVIVCTDGGGLCDTVRDGENGLVVEPTGAAIAAAVERIRSDPGLHGDLADGASASAAAYTWSRAFGQLDGAIEQVVS